MDPITLRRWRAGEDISARVRLLADELGVAQTFLRLREHAVDGYVVESLNGTAQVTMPIFLKFYSFARRARRQWKPQFARMRLERYGSAREVTATHQGDLRIGCTLVPWSELERIHGEWVAMPVKYE